MLVHKKHHRRSWKLCVNEDSNSVRLLVHRLRQALLQILRKLPRDFVDTFIRSTMNRGGEMELVFEQSFVFSSYKSRLKNSIIGLGPAHRDSATAHLFIFNHCLSQHNTTKYSGNNSICHPNILHLHASTTARVSYLSSLHFFPLPPIIKLYSISSAHW